LIGIAFTPPMLKEDTTGRFSTAFLAAAAILLTHRDSASGQVASLVHTMERKYCFPTYQKTSGIMFAPGWEKGNPEGSINARPVYRTSAREPRNGSEDNGKYSVISNDHQVDGKRIPLLIPPLHS
jgi:hypothetical protein